MKKRSPKRTKAYLKAYRIANPDKAKLWRKTYYKANKNKILAHNKIYHEANLELHRTQVRAWQKTHKKEINAYQKQKRKINPKFKINCNIKTAISHSLKGNKNGRCWENLVGYTIEKLINHLERQFVNGMSWANYGKTGWEIDHKIPVSVFNFTKPEHEDFKRCWALKNLQPMWAKENREKQDKLTKHFQPSLSIGF